MQAEFVIAEIVESVSCHAYQTKSIREVLPCGRHNNRKLGVKGIEALIMRLTKSRN